MAAPHAHFLVGDVGATNTRLAITTLRDGAVEWIHEVRVADAELSTFDDAIDALFVASPVERTRIAADYFFDKAREFHRVRDVLADLASGDVPH
jgi:glucokinase